jgi:hypothetical protein
VCSREIRDLVLILARDASLALECLTLRAFVYRFSDILYKVLCIAFLNYSFRILCCVLILLRLLLS